MSVRKMICGVLCACMLAGCSKNTVETDSSSQTYSNLSLDGFDTVLSYQETTDDKEKAQEHFEEVSSLWKRYNDLFDIYNDYDGINNLKMINDNAGKQPVYVDHDIIEMLLTAKEFYDLSDGEFDITMGSVLSVWHKYREDGITKNENNEKGSLPSQEELEEAASHRGWDHIQINEDKGTVYIDDPDVSLDVGGIAKGFATEKMAQALEKEGVSSGTVINAGGNNRTIGKKADGTPWRVGIQNPDGDGSLFAISVEGSMSFVTSGDYERYYVAEDGKRYSHIIDPRTLWPATDYRSVTIVTNDSGVADCLSTTLFTMSYEDGNALLNKYKAEHPDITLEAIWIMDSSKAIKAEHSNITGNYFVAYTEGLEDKITWQ